MKAKLPLIPEFQHGWKLPGLDFRLDPPRACSTAFISHAHSDHFARHARVVCSFPTADLLASRYGMAETRLDPRPFFQSWEENGHCFELLPAGHVLGSAMLHVTRLDHGASLLYTGDFKLRPCLTAEAPSPKPAGMLIMETTFGRPRYVFPPREEVWAQVRQFVRDALEDGAVPVVVGYSLGKAQEIIANLASLGFPILAHPAIMQLDEPFRKHCPVELPPLVSFSKGMETTGHVLVVPPNAVRSLAVRKIRQRRVMVLTGWGLDSGAGYRYQADAVAPISDHADYPELLQLVEIVQPARVLTVHGFEEEFAATLRARGVEAWSGRGTDQLELFQNWPPIPGIIGAEAVTPEADEHQAYPSQAWEVGGGTFAGWAATGDAMAMAAGNGDKIRLLAEFLRSLSPADLPHAARFLAGYPLGNQSGKLQIGWATLRRAVLAATGVGETRYREISQHQRDAGRTTYLVFSLTNPAHSASDWTLEQAVAEMGIWAGLTGLDARLSAVTARLRKLNAREASWLVRLLTGDIRAGLKAGLLEEAIAAAFSVDVESVRRAHMLTGDAGECARRVRDGSLAEAGLSPFVAVQSMLASPEPDAAAVFSRMGGGTIWLEDKFDGIRAQLHKVGDLAKLFSRDSRDISAEFPEICQAARCLSDDLVLDGEIIAHADGRKLGFQDLQKRLGRKLLQGDLFLGASVPVRFLAFDCLWHQGQSLIDMPLAERRQHLDTLSFPASLEAVPVYQADCPEQIDRAFADARRRGNEGLMAKDPSSPYSPGRRGKAWIKLKMAEITLDVVVVRVEQGHGKRAHVLSDYTFAVRDEEKGELSIIGKAYSGLTDEEIEELTEHFERQSLGKIGKAREVVPDIVLEVACDRLQPSKRHPSGLAMRFPRIKAIRRDKKPEEADTLETARKLAGLG